MVLLITYEIQDKTRDLTKLYATIMSAGAWWHHIGNFWLVQTLEKPEEWHKKLSPYLTNKDHIFIARITREYYGSLPATAWEWLKNQNF